ncbi:nucleotide sugar dehydrogenase [Acidobacteriota bacterium]
MSFGSDNSMISENRPNSALWRVEKIVVVGAGIVGVPMAATLAEAEIRLGTDSPAHVVIIQRNSSSSGWKVDVINSGRSPIGGLEPDLGKIVSRSVAEGLLSATHEFSEIHDADVILVCVQTDKIGFEPDYGPLFSALDSVGEELTKTSTKKCPLIVIESTLAPSSMQTVIKKHFKEYGLEDGRDVFLGFSPNRVMPGRLVQRIKTSDKVISGLHRSTLIRLHALYSRIVLKGNLLSTNCMTAEVVKTLENAYRDVRIAYTTEIARHCDAYNIDFYNLRELVNQKLGLEDNASKNPNTVPSGGLLIPGIGVGGHCLPKDGILLLWRQIESGSDVSSSIILEARSINDESPSRILERLKKQFTDLSERSVVLLGAAYRFNSSDTRNSPTLQLACQLMEIGCDVALHDPFVSPEDQNLIRMGLQKHFSQSLEESLASAEILVFCAAHNKYLDEVEKILGQSPILMGVFDGCNLLKRSDFVGKKIKYIGIGKGENPPSKQLLDNICRGFRALEKGFANEIQRCINFLNEFHAKDDFNQIEFSEVQRIAGTCVTGCYMVNPGPISHIPPSNEFASRLLRCAEEQLK